MNDRELMQQALEMIEDARNGSQRKPSEPVITALRERLAQPEQDWDWRHPKAQALIGAKARLEIKLRLVEQLVEDPNLETTASDMEYWEPLHDKLQERLAQPEQEPVAWAYHEGLEAFKSGKPWTAYGSNGDGRIPLYLNDAVARKWQGLTDEDVVSTYGADMKYRDGDYMRFARAIEAKLKLKNA